MKNSEAVAMLKEWKVLVDGIHKESKLLKPETQKDLKAKSEALQLAIEAMEWVPVSDPPKEDGYYLVAIPDEHRGTFFVQDEFNVGVGFDMHPEIVTHWKPITPPEEV